MSKVERLDAFFRDIWIAGNTDATIFYFTPDARVEGLVPGYELTPDDFATTVQGMLAIIIEPQISLHQVVEQDDWIAAVVRAQCLSHEDGRRVTFDCHTMCRYEGDLIAHAYNAMDTAGLMVQLGLLPPDAIERLLTQRGL